MRKKTAARHVDASSPKDAFALPVSVMHEPTVTIERQDAETLRVLLAGQWKTGQSVSLQREVSDRLTDAGLRRVQFDSRQLAGWDSSLAVFVSQVSDACAAKGIAVDTEGLPAGVCQLMALASVVARREDDAPAPAKSFLLTRIGEAGLTGAASVKNTLDFIGELAESFARLFTGRARFRATDVMTVIQECGWQALGIVSLISGLVGLILAFMGAVQLKMFGAQIYIADLVGIGMAREMGVVMAGVIMAGRTGAAFAANIGTMQVSEEVDALQTLGVSPMDYLVMPRVAALVMMMPLLTVYADFMGLLGGMVVGVGVFDISIEQYLNETRHALTMAHFYVGLVKSVFFGLIVAISGCMQGMQCGRSAADVGRATTSAVVIAIVWIVVADGIFAVVTNILGV